MLRRPRIAVDLDGVLAETMEAWCRIANERFGTRIRLDDLDTWTSWRKIGIAKDQFFEILDETWDTWEDIPPTEPNLAVKVAKVEKLGSLDIVTGRSRQTVEHAKDWLAHHKITYERFVRVRGWRDKVFLNYDVYIDDAPELMPLISRNPVMRGILYGRPWNKDVHDMPGVFKVESWEEIPGVLKQITKRQPISGQRKGGRSCCISALWIKGCVEDGRVSPVQVRFRVPSGSPSTPKAMPSMTASRAL